MTLNQYQSKRNFNQTSEPKGEISKNNKKRFVVHKHQASHLHYDFRLEMEDVLKSWAIPKGIPEKPKIKHLAIKVEDHPIEYIDFEGEIPKGNYGAGKVEIWDKGTYGIIKQQVDKIGKIKSMQIELNGKKCKGKYILIYYKENQWLIQKI